MDLQEWRAKRVEGERMVLPSGLEVRLRRVSLMDLALLGDVPAPLTAHVNAVMERGLQSITVENATQYEAAINLVVQAAVVTPSIGAEAAATILGVRELPIIDRLAIFRECNQYAERLRPFRSEQAVVVESA